MTVPGLVTSSAVSEILERPFPTTGMDTSTQDQDQSLDPLSRARLLPGQWLEVAAAAFICNLKLKEVLLELERQSSFRLLIVFK